MQVAILAGGLATRLGDLTKKQPKSLVMVQDRPFLEYQLEFLRRGGVREVVLCIGNLSEQIESYFGDGSKFGVSIKYSCEPRPLGTAGALKNARQLLQDEFITLYGDSYLFLDFVAIMSYFKRYNSPALMTVYRNCDRYDRSNTVVEGDRVKVHRKKDKIPEMVYIEYGANVLTKKILDTVPGEAPSGLDDLFERLAEKGQLLAYEIKERFYEIGSPKGLVDFTAFVRNEAPRTNIFQHFDIRTG